MDAHGGYVARFLPVRATDGLPHLSGCEKLRQDICTTHAPTPGLCPAHERTAQAHIAAAPNPFTTETRLTLHLPAPLPVPGELLLYDALGRLTDRLPLAAGPAGVRYLTWRPGALVAPGVYYGRSPATGRPVVVRRL